MGKIKMKFVEFLGIFCNIATPPFYPWIFVKNPSDGSGGFFIFNTVQMMDATGRVQLLPS